MKKIKSLSDETLIGLICSQDKELYEKIVFRYQGKLLRYALFLVGDEDKAADVVQSAFVKAYINLKGFKRQKKFSSWIYRIVHNEAINFIKKQKKEISLEKNEWIKDSIKSSEDIEKDFDKAQVKEMLLGFLEKLPLPYRVPLILFYLEEKTYEEISDILRIPKGTVGTRINRGKKAMKIIYKRKGGEYGRF